METTNKLNRRQFIETSGNLLLTGVGMSVLTSLLTSCGYKKNPTGPPPGNNNGTTGKTFVVNLNENPALQQVGGFKIFELGSTPVILFRVSESTFKTLSRICTHQGCTVNWQPANNRFECPCHGSRYDQDGNVQRGPAPRSLSTYRTEFDAANNLVTIYY
ncbi:MAG: ubiquinol-cytochrome c reductase iron-sulfur subunit [candidate division KSB1 bacterium]|nr:ubiquinol-cytochrome c reductase iron-sulfur subunit [candidate division KSB1 bacterium]MDZ7305183.1 ubiquinol-cytochrome c reductase iron-sulfur subunit [candidate division KSB1 bacterium]